MKRSYRRSPTLVLVLAALVLAGALALFLFNAVFVVREIEVVGAGEVPETEVRHLSGIRMGARLGSVDAERVRSDVESDGRLAFVDLETRFPNRVVLTVRPRTLDALVLLAASGRALVLDSEGYVARVVERLPDAVIPYVTGLKTPYYMLGRQIDGADGRRGAMTAVLEALKANRATGYASELSVANTDDLRIITRKGTTVLLGNYEDMDRKIAWMAAALADLEARGENGGRLDVSSGNKADYMPPSAAEGDASQGTEAAGQEPVQTEVDQTIQNQTGVDSSDLQQDGGAGETPAS